MLSLRGRVLVVAFAAVALVGLSPPLPADLPGHGGPKGKLARLEGIEAGGYAFPSVIVDPKTGDTLVVAELAGAPVLVRFGAALKSGAVRPLVLPVDGPAACGIGRRSLALSDGVLSVASHGWTEPFERIYTLHRCPLSPAGAPCTLVALERQRLEHLVTISPCNHRLEGPPLFREVATGALWLPTPVHGGRVSSMVRCLGADCSREPTPMGEEAVSFGRAADGRPLGLVLDGEPGSQRLSVWRCDPVTKACAKTPIGGAGYLLPPVGTMAKRPGLAGAHWTSVHSLTEGAKIHAVLMAGGWSSGSDWAMALLRCSLTACTVRVVAEGADADPLPSRVLFDPKAGLFIVGRRDDVMDDDVFVTRCMPDGTACRSLYGPAGPRSDLLDATLDLPRRRVVVTHADARAGALLVRTFPY